MVHLNRSLKALNLPSLSQTTSREGPLVMILGIQETIEHPILQDLPVPGEEGYRLLVDQDRVWIQGVDPAGCYYGLVTLANLLDSTGRIPRVVVSDWPDMRFRGTYMAGYKDYEQYILRFSSLKINHVLFECGTLFELEDPAVRERWQEIFSFCRKHFVEPIPELQSWGWGQHVLRLEPRVAEGIYVENRPFEVREGQVDSSAPPVPSDIPIINPSFESFQGHQMLGWQQERPAEGTFVEKNDSTSGTSSLQIVVQEEGTLRAWQDVACQAGVPYELSCQLKTENITGQGAYIEVYGLEGPDQLGKLLGKPNAAFSGTRDWHKMAVRFQTEEYSLLRIYVRIQEGKGQAWFDEVAIRGLPPLHPLDNVMVTEAAPVTVMDELGKTRYEEGGDYTVHPGQIQFPYEKSAPLRILIPRGSRIQDGDTVLLSYHQAPEGSITCCPSDPVYQEFMRKSIHLAVRHLQPSFLHIGHDEPRIVNRDKRCTDRGLTDTEIFVDDVNRMFAYLQEADPKVKLMMWNDALDPYHAEGFHRVIGAADLIPKDIIICIWWYDWPDEGQHLERSVPYFLERGFHITGSPWFRRNNAYQWAQVLNQYGKKDSKVMGHLYTSWWHPSEDPWGALDVTAEYAWSFDRPVFPE